MDTPSHPISASLDQILTPQRSSRCWVSLVKHWRLIVGMALALFSPLGQASPESAPNIILIVADDLGYGQLGCYGQTKIRTPRIDQMAKEGTRFTQFYAGHCVCAPSRSVLMTGQHTGHTSVRINGSGSSLLSEDVTLAEVMKTVGYRTGCFGKWSLGDIDTPGMPLKQGFDEFFGYLDQIHAHFYYPWFLWDNDQKFTLHQNLGSKRNQYSHDLIVERALSFVRRHQDERFFLYMPLTIPHFELLVPEDSMAEYEGAFPEPWDYQNNHYADQPKPRATMAAMITRMDRDVGRVFDLLASLDLDRKTLVLFTSDNGAYLMKYPSFFKNNGMLRGAKGMFYEGGIRVPMIARWPGVVPAGKTDDLIWAFWDLFPTLSELAVATDLPSNDGVSYARRLQGLPQPNPERLLYWETQPRNQGGQAPWRIAARRGPWKILRNRPDQPWQLYHLETDPGERQNLASQQPLRVQEFAALLPSLRTIPRIFPPQEPTWSYPPEKTGFVK